MSSPKHRFLERTHTAERRPFIEAQRLDALTDCKMRRRVFVTLSDDEVEWFAQGPLNCGRSERVRKRLTKCADYILADHDLPERNL